MVQHMAQHVATCTTRRHRAAIHTHSLRRCGAQVDLLSEGKYAELMMARPRTSGDIVTWVWCMFFIGSTVATVRSRFFRVYLFICLFVCLFVCLSVCLFVCLSVCLFVCSFVRSGWVWFVCFRRCVSHRVSVLGSPTFGLVRSPTHTYRRLRYRRGSGRPRARGVRACATVASQPRTA